MIVHLRTFIEHTCYSNVINYKMGKQYIYIYYIYILYIYITQQRDIYITVEELKLSTPSAGEQRFLLIPIL